MKTSKGRVVVLLMLMISTFAFGCSNKNELEQHRVDCNEIISICDPPQLIEEYVKAYQNEDIVMLQAMLYGGDSLDFKSLFDKDAFIPTRVVSIEKSISFNELTEKQWSGEKPLYEILSYTTVLEFSCKDKLIEAPYEFSFIKTGEDALWQLYNYGF